MGSKEYEAGLKIAGDVTGDDSSWLVGDFFWPVGPLDNFGYTKKSKKRWRGWTEF